GNVIEVYADFSGLGKNYDHFPDRHSYRLSMDDLLREDVQQRLAAQNNDYPTQSKHNAQANGRSRMRQETPVQLQENPEKLAADSPTKRRRRRPRYRRQGIQG
ncbi:MAG: hypothetical protein ACK4SA_19575, partial [Caldilinea sp.]